MEGQRTIAHMDLDSFFVSVERLYDSSLIDKPVLVGGSSDRGVVTSCSYEARKFGVHSAMPIRTAKRLCPSAIVVPGNFERYSHKSKEVTQIIHETVPLFEKSSIDEFFLDLSGMDRFFNSFKLAQELRQRIIRETGLPISLGFSANKTVSKIATGEAKPNNEKQILVGHEKEFLAPLPVRKIPMIGAKTTQKLLSMGIEKIHTLQEMSKQHLEQTFGKQGKMIWEKANGIDRRPLVPYTEEKSISCENTFSKDVCDPKKLEASLTSMCEQLASRLRKKNRLTACLSVKVRYSNFETHTQQMNIPYTSADHVLLPYVKRLYYQLNATNRPIRLIGLKFSNLIFGNYQIRLFEDTQELIKLYQALDHLNVKFGAKTVCRAVGMSIGRRQFNPFNGRET